MDIKSSSKGTMARRPPGQELTVFRKQAMFGDVSVGGGEIFT